MLKDLQVINGNMSLKFDSLNTIYTIHLSDDSRVLKFQYEINEKDSISVVGNDLKKGVNEVVLTVYNDKEMMSYYLYVYKDKILQASVNNDNETSLNVDLNNRVSDYALPVISSVCFITILLFFTLLFRKRKN